MPEYLRLQRLNGQLRCLTFCRQGSRSEMLPERPKLLEPISVGRRCRAMLTVNTDLGRTHVQTASDVEDADIAMATHLASHRDHPVVRGLGTLSEVGDQPPLLALSGAVLAFGVLTRNRRATEAGARMIASLVLATWLKTGLKRLVARTRPNVLLQEGRYEVEPLGPDEGSWHSFPSGHTAGSVALSRAVSRTYPEARPVAYTAAAAIALV